MGYDLLVKLCFNENKIKVSFMEDRLTVGRSQFEKVWIIILMKTLQSYEFGLKKNIKSIKK